MAESYPKVAQLRTPDALRQRIAELNLDLPVDDQIVSAADGSPLAQSLSLGPLRVGNRWCIHPMEGWDAHPDGSPSEHTLRRWRNFGRSGAKLIWGGEAAAVQPAGRANPNQTLAVRDNLPGLAALRDELLQAHAAEFHVTDDLVVGLQLTHSGRFCCPYDKQRTEPKIAYHHPLLDEKFEIDPDDQSVVLTDSDLERLIDDYVSAAGVAREAGYQFVDIKCCHGYLMHELLSGYRRPGRFGGDFENRTRVLRTIIQRVQQEQPQLAVAVRLSAFDTPPYRTSHSVGEPMDYQHLLPYRLAFGAAEDEPLQMDLSEPVQLLQMLQQLGVVAVNISCGSPYYNPHLQRPAIFPPSDGYLPPEDPLVGVARQIHAARQCKAAVPGLPLVGSGYTYLQQFVPHVAQALVRDGWIDLVGLGRMVLAYPELPADSLAGKQLLRKRICRTFSDCTTAPRNGLLSGCFPLDPYYKALPEAKQLAEVKKMTR